MTRKNDQGGSSGHTVMTNRQNGSPYGLTSNYSQRGSPEWMSRADRLKRSSDLMTKNSMIKREHATLLPGEATRNDLQRLWTERLARKPRQKRKSARITMCELTCWNHQKGQPERIAMTDHQKSCLNEQQGRNERKGLR